ncbi:MAG TPA: hypothetical protein VEB21_17605 [Terriglobales bacterium]|nr:hypothetical protein [Terriglobales bacterium]
MIEVADINAELERAGGDDDAVAAFLKCVFRRCSYRQRERRMREINVNASLRQAITCRDPSCPLEQRHQVGAAIVTNEGVHLIDYNRANVRQNALGRFACAEQHRLERFGRDRQDVGPILDEPW